MAWTIGKLKCYFCKDKDGLFHSVCDYGIYGDVGKRINYHPECLKMIEVDPERFGHIQADKAIHINGLRKHCIKKCNKYIVQKFEKKVELLHQAHFERMIPPRV